MSDPIFWLLLMLAAACAIDDLFDQWERGSDNK